MSGSSINSRWVGDFEIGFRIIVYITRLFTENYMIMNTIWALSVFACEVFIIRELYNNLVQSKNEAQIEQLCLIDKNKGALSLFNAPPFISIVASLWFLYFGNVFFTRSTLAMMLQLLSIEYAEKGKLKKFCAVILIATLFHRTSLLFLMVYLIINSNHFVFRYFHVSSIILSGIMAIFGSRIIAAIGQFMPQSVQYRLGVYSENYLKVRLSGIINTIFLFMVFYVIYYICARKNKRFMDLIKIYSFSLVPYAVGIAYNGYFIRMAYPYMLVQILLIPRCIQSFSRNGGGRILVCIIIIVYMLLRMFSNLDSYDVFIPFNTNL